MLSRRILLRSAALTGAGAGLSACTDWSATLAGLQHLARWRSAAQPLLFDQYPKLSAIPWLPLADLPTPVQRLTGLEAAAGLKNLWIKRDDLTSTLYGGNKVRKNEFLLADAIATRKNALVTVGGIGSHHCCSIAAFGQAYNLDVTLVHSPQPVTSHVQHMLRRNLLYDPTMVLSDHYPEQFWDAYAALARYREQKKHPYFIWAGGSSPIGTLSYLNAGLELARQIEQGTLPMPEAIFVATGSGGTLAGLAAAFKAQKLKSKLIGVSVVPWPASSQTMVTFLANRMLGELGKIEAKFAGIRVHNDDFAMTHDFLGDGYGHPTDAGEQALGLMIEMEDIPLETTYTGKTLAAMLAYSRNNKGHGPLLFWNTFNSTPAPTLPSYTRLPNEYHRFFDA